MKIDTDQMKIAHRLNGTAINGYGGYFGHIREDTDDYLIIAIPHDKRSVERLMQEIELKL